MKKYIYKLSCLIAALFILYSCSDEPTEPVVVDPGESSTELLSKKTSSAPTIDGVKETLWDACKRLKFEVTVPDPLGASPITYGLNYFIGYIGNKYTVTLRSMYDDDNIYFLATWDDPTESLNRDPWYFDPGDKLWKQEKRAPVFDAGGNKTREAFYEDKFAMLWNINESMSSFNSTGCYATCHMSLDANTHFGAPALHYTNAATEKIDMWHWKSVRTPGQIDDQYIDDSEFGGSGPTSPLGGRKTDSKTSGGYSDNKQKLKVTGTPDSVTVPKYVVVSKTNYYWIMKSEINDGSAKLITGVDANGVLTYDGGTIDPNTDTEFQRKGEGSGSKCVPSVTVDPPIIGDRGDITAGWKFTAGMGWTLEYKRALSTGSATDVQFNPLNDYTFGAAVFENAAIAHAIQPKLLLKFAK